MPNPESAPKSNREPYVPPNIFSPDFTRAHQAESEQNESKIPREVSRSRGKEVNEVKMATDPAPQSADPASQPADQAPQPDDAAPQSADQAPQSNDTEDQPTAPETQPATPATEVPFVAPERLNLDELSTDDLIKIGNQADLSQYTLEELTAAKARLEQEYIARYGRPYQPQRKAAPEQSSTDPSPRTDDSGIDIIVADNSPARATPDTSPTEPITRTSSPEPVTDTPTPVAVSPESAASFESISPEQARATYERSKNNSANKGFFSKVGNRVIAGVVAAAIAVGAFAGFAHFNQQANADQGPNQPSVTQVGEQQEAQHGIRDGYYDPGRYNSSNKSTAVDFAYAPEVAKDIGSNDAREIAIAVADSQVETMANQIAAMPDEVKAHFGLADFKGLGWKAVEQKLEEANAASPDLFDSMEQCYQNAMRAAEYRIDHISGTVVNGYIQHNGSGAYAHGNMEGVQCATQENNTSVARFAWPQLTDEDMMMKIQYDEHGNVIGGCTQVIILAGTDKALIVMDGVPSITELPPTPDTGDEGTGDEGTGSEGTGNEGTGSEDTGNEGTGNEGTGNEDTGNEGTGSEDTGNEGTGDEGTGSEGTDWGKSGDPHGGDLVDYSDLVDPGSEVDQNTSENAHQDNQVYVDDNQAAPGSPSDNNGVDESGFSQIITDGADTDGGRLTGGEQQGSSEINGTNANAPTPEQIAAEQHARDVQNAAQVNNTPFGDNNSDAEEVNRVAEGNF